MDVEMEATAVVAVLNIARKHQLASLISKVSPHFNFQNIVSKNVPTFKKNPGVCGVGRHPNPEPPLLERMSTSDL